MKMNDTEKIEKIKELLEQWRYDSDSWSDDYMNKIDDIVYER